MQHLTALAYEAALDPTRWPGFQVDLRDTLDRLGADASPAHLALAEALRPHLARAIAIRARLQEAASGTADLALALEALPYGVILVDRGGNALRTNAAAASVAAEVLAAVRALPDGPRQDVRTLTVRARRSGRPRTVMVVPVRETALEAAVPGAAEVVFVTDPAPAPLPPPEVIGSVFGLTPGEAGVALAVAGGRSPKEVAASLGISVHTVKTLLRRVFQRTGTSSQADLVRVLLAWIPRLPAAPERAGHA